MDKFIAMVTYFLAPQFVLHYLVENLKREVEKVESKVEKTLKCKR